jgi:hypothetical protein
MDKRELHDLGKCDSEGFLLTKPDFKLPFGSPLCQFLVITLTSMQAQPFRLSLLGSQSALPHCPTARQ